MKHDRELNNLFDFLATQKIMLSDYQKRQVGQYTALLAKWSKKINLISKNDIPRIVERHILVSFYYVYVLQRTRKNQRVKLIDIGTGAGLPGVILSIYFPENQILLLDSSRKKFLFLKRVFKELDLKSELVCERLENLDIQAENKFNIAVLRAVAGLDVLSRWGKLILKEHGMLYSLKGDNCQAEYTERDLRGINLINMPVENKWVEFSEYLKNKTMICLEY